MIREDVIEFIKRRFPMDCNWLSGNCYYFAVILKERFPEATLWYEITVGHFIVMIEGEYYDWTGHVERQDDCIYVPWNEMQDYDENVYHAIIEGCTK